MTTLYTNPFSAPLSGTEWSDPPGSNWQVPSAGTAGFVRGASSGGFQWLVTTTTAHAAVADVKVSAIRVANSTLEGGLLARFSGSAGSEQCYALDSYSTNTLGVYRCIAGALTLVAARTGAFTNGDKISLQVTGTAPPTFKIFVNDVQIGADITDTDPAKITGAGQAGLATFEAGNIDFDTFLVETATGATSSTITPGVGSITAAGRAPSTIASFSNVRIRDVLINESGQPIASATGINLLVWYAGFPSGAANVSLNGMTTDANGTISWSIATGTLIYGQAIFYVATSGDTSPSAYTCARMTPAYE